MDIPKNRKSKSLYGGLSQNAMKQFVIVMLENLPRRYIEAPHQKFILYTVQKFMTKGTLFDCQRQGKAAAAITARFPANIDRVRASVQQSSKKSLRRRSQKLGISVTSLQRMLRKDLSKFPYKISTCHKLTDTDKQKRTEMCCRVAE